MGSFHFLRSNRLGIRAFKTLHCVKLYEKVFMMILCIFVLFLILVKIYFINVTEA